MQSLAIEHRDTPPHSPKAARRSKDKKAPLKAVRNLRNFPPMTRSSPMPASLRSLDHGLQRSRVLPSLFLVAGKKLAALAQRP